MSQGTFVARRPIVDRDERVVHHELLCRSSRVASAADFDDIDECVLRALGYS